MTTEEIKQQLTTKFKVTLDSFGGDQHRAAIFLDRYSRRDANNVPVELTYVETISRLAELVDSDQIKHLQAIDLLKDFRFVPGGRIIAGPPFDNCLTLPHPKDTLLGEGGIINTAVLLAKALKNQAGVGFRIDSLRPKGTKLKSSVGVATGPVSFMQLFDSITSIINQGGSRKGALLLAMTARHPDILEFINYKKSDSTALSNINISVLCDDAFMDAVKNDTNIFQTFTEASVPARPIWEALCLNAWESGDPGIIYEDTMKADFVEIEGYPFELTNACSEIPLPSFGVCLLGSINLMQHVTPEGGIKYDKLSETTDLAVRFLDRIIDLGGYPLPECEEVQKATRRIGIGVMGLAHALIHCGVCYDDATGRYVAERVFKTITQQAKITSKILGNGVQHNAALVAGPPTGTTADLAGVSPGIEPVFFEKMLRQDGMGEGYEVLDPLFAIGRKKHGKSLPDHYQIAHDISPVNRVAMQAAIQAHVDNAISSTVNLPSIATVEDVGNVFMQAWESKCKSITIYRDGSRSNAPIQEAKPNAKSELDVDELIRSLDEPEEITSRDSLKAFNQIWEEDCGKEDLTKHYEERPFELEAKCYKVPYHGDVNLYITVAYKDGKPFEIFLHSKKAEHIAWCNALTILISSFLQGRLTLDLIIDKLKGIIEPGGGAFTKIGDKGCRVNSGPAALGLVLEHFLESQESSKPMIFDLSVKEDEPLTTTCPNCSTENFIYLDDIWRCKACDYNVAKSGQPIVTDLDSSFKGKPMFPASGEDCPNCHQPFLMPIEGCMTCAACGYSKC